MIKPFLKGILGIVLLRGGPQNLPYSPATLLGFILAGIVTVSFIAGNYVALLLVKVSFMLAIVWILLHHLKKGERYIQTMTALVACEWVMSIVFTLLWYAVLAITALSGHLKGISANNLYAIFNMSPDPNLLPRSVMGLLGLGLVLLAIWKLVVNISIIRQAADWNSARAIAFVLIYTLFPAIIQQAVLNTGLIGDKPATKMAVATPAKPAQTTTTKPVIPLN